MTIDLEIKTISKICLENKIKEAFQKGLNDTLFLFHLEKWQYIKTYYKQYKKLTLEVLKGIYANIPTEKEIKSYDLDFLIERMRNRFLKNQMVSVLETTSNDLIKNTPVRNIIDRHLGDIRKLTTVLGVGHDINLTKDAMSRYEELERRRTKVKNQGLVGITTGIEVLDNYTGGVLPNDVWIVVGRTGMGKSWLLLKMAVEAWKAGYTPLMINLEMGQYEIGFRMDTLISKQFSNIGLMQGKISDIDIKEYKKFIEKNLSKNRDFWLITRAKDSTRFTMIDLEAKIIEYEPDIVFVDYLNLLNTTTKFSSIWEKVTVLTRDMKAIARRGTPIIVVVQAGRGAARKSGYLPKIHQIAHSDSVGRDSDKILSISRVRNEDDGKDYMRCALIKNRGGREIEEFWLYWDVDKGYIATKEDFVKERGASF